MISLSDTQLKTVMAAASHIPHGKRSQFLERIGAMLALRGRGHFNDADVADAVARALQGLIQELPASSPAGIINFRLGQPSAPRFHWAPAQ